MPQVWRELNSFDLAQDDVEIRNTRPPPSHSFLDSFSLVFSQPFPYSNRKMLLTVAFFLILLLTNATLSPLEGLPGYDCEIYVGPEASPT